MHARLPTFVTLLGLVHAMSVFAATGHAQDNESGVRFAKIFTDHMVLQQQKKARVWGFAEPGAKVVVTITEDRPAALSFATDSEPKASGEYAITARYVESNAPEFRAQTLTGTADQKGAWQVEFAAMVAGFTPKYLMAKVGDEVAAIQNVLIGEIWVCAGQSNMGWGNFNRKGREAASADFPGLRYVAWDDSWYKPLDDVRKNIKWQECSPETAQRFSAVPYLYGMFLHRYLKVPVGIINVARGGTLGQTWCTRGRLDAVDSEIVKTVLRDYDVETARWDDPEQVKQITAAWEQACATKRAEHERRVADAEAKGEKKPRLRLPKKPGDPRSGWSPPAGLFNATVMPIRKLGVRGVLYYQGENQAFNRWTRYEHTFPQVPASFREAFGDANLPFGCISQPGWGNFGEDPEISTASGSYQIVRDIQHRALKDDPNGHLIATYPTGNSYIHPAEKLPVAEYASLWALARVYGKPVVHTGSTYREIETKGDKAYLFFDNDPIVYDRWKHIEKNAYWQVLPCPREGNADFRGFIIAGADRRWYPAKARHTRLDDAPCIEVWSDLVAKPVAVRYGWAAWPTGNMVGRERLPMPTFRTDDWPLPVGVNYSPEAEAVAKRELARLRELAERQALDRKIRQMQFDIPELEKKLYLSKNRSSKKLVVSKLDRLNAILDELQNDRWLSGQLRKHEALTEHIEAVRKAVAAARSASDVLQDKR